MSKRVLITGGAGFVGSQLGFALDQAGCEVILLDNMSDGHEDNLVIDGRRFGRFEKMDARDKQVESLLSGVDTVFHFAGTSSLPKCQVDPAAAYDNNVTAVLNMLECSRRAGVRRFTFSSTSAVYENNKTTPFSESDPVAPDLVYASTKYAAEQACAGFASTYGMDVIVARFFNVYGEHQDIHRTMPPFISYLAREVFFGRRPVLFNNTDAERDYVYVGDIIACMRKMMDSEQHFTGDVFNICSGTGYSVPQIARLYGEIAGQTIDPEYRDPTGFWDKFPGLFEGAYPLSRKRIEAEVYKRSLGNPDKAAETFGFRTSMALDEGLRRFHAYSVAHLG